MKAAISVHDVAAYILNKLGKVTTWKLQKLVYYAQAWSLVWDDRPLFGERIEAWANGPVAPDLYKEHVGKFEIQNWPKGDPDHLDEPARETIDAVLKFYGDKGPQWLSDLTHQEPPWKDAREGLKPGQRGNKEITTAAMAEYYTGLYGEEEQGT